MATYLLVHGAWHGGWCWEWVRPLLEAAGHRVLTPDLPGMGASHGVDRDTSFAAGVARLTGLIEAEAAPVILVGHSLGGVPATQTADATPGKIAALVYLTGFAPQDGESGLALALQDHGIVPYGLEIAADGSVCTVRDEWIKPSFYNDCDDARVTFAKERLKPQPMEPYSHPVALGGSGASALRRVYIECLRDHAITPGFQEKMAALYSGTQMLKLDAGHSPFFSTPEKTVELLLSLA